MSEPEFWQTAAGRAFYERTVPDLVRQLARAGDALERVARALETRADAKPADPASGAEECSECSIELGHSAGRHRQPDGRLLCTACVEAEEAAR